MWNRQRLSESRAAATLVDRTRRFPYLLTSLAAGLAIAVVLAAVVADVQVLEVPLAALDRIERHETGAIATVILLMIAAFITDYTVAGRRTHRERHLQNQRLRISRPQYERYQHPHTSLNQLQLIRFEAEDYVSHESLALFDAAIQETAAELRALGDLDAYAERHTTIGAALSGNGAAGTGERQAEPTQFVSQQQDACIKHVILGAEDCDKVEVESTRVIESSAIRGRIGQAGVRAVPPLRPRSRSVLVLVFVNCDRRRIHDAIGRHFSFDGHTVTIGKIAALFSARIIRDTRRYDGSAVYIQRYRRAYTTESCHLP